ncbi:MAG: hypothetical protein WCP52_08880 [Bacteroidota bacterium]
MKSILILTLLLLGFSSCKSKKETTQTSNEVKQTTTVTNNEQMSAPKTKGKVSHQFRSEGCATVILANVDKSTIVLIPSIKLIEKFDVDGMAIAFDYRPLKMHNPEGCNVGIPAEISNITDLK